MHMLKEKLSLLVHQHLPEQKNFEIISDPDADGLYGGIKQCLELAVCLTFTGYCPNLQICSEFS